MDSLAYTPLLSLIHYIILPYTVQMIEKGSQQKLLVYGPSEFLPSLQLILIKLGKMKF